MNSPGKKEPAIRNKRNVKIYASLKEETKAGKENHNARLLLIAD